MWVMRTQIKKIYEADIQQEKVLLGKLFLHNFGKEHSVHRAEISLLLEPQTKNDCKNLDRH